MNGFDAEGFRRELEQETGHQPSWDVEGFDDIDASVREQLAVLRSSPWMCHTGEVLGFVYDVTTGRLRQVT
jgi:carbonic anhydrase